jgi:hypothetical protein
MSVVRPVVYGIFRREYNVLVAEGYDRNNRTLFYRPPGGPLGFGETAEESLVRLMKEQFDSYITVGPKLAVFENIYSLNDAPGHEIVFLYEAEFKSLHLYGLETYELPEDKNGEPVMTRFSWHNLFEFHHRKRLYPQPLYDLLKDIRPPRLVKSGG